MKNEVKRIDIKEFREMGFLQELNRQFLHPLGLALEVVIDDKDGSEKLGGVWDYRDDPEGMLYQKDMTYAPDFIRKIDTIDELRRQKAEVRRRKFGYVVQPAYDQYE